MGALIAARTAVAAASGLAKRVPLHWWVIGALVALSGWQWMGRKQAERDAYAARMETANVAAAADATRLVLEDSVARVVQRLAVQQEAARDSIDKLLGVVSRARVTATIEVNAVERRLPGTVDPAPADSTVRLAHFVMDEAPFHLDIRASVPPPPEPASAEIRLRLDPIPLGVRLACQPPEHGVSRASVIVVGPKWAEVNVDGVQQHPSVCNQPVSVKGPTRLRWAALGGGAVLTALLAWEFAR